jgi:hypothetical protein
MKIYQENNEQIFCYDLEKGIMIFSGDTTEVGGFIDFMNECFENLENYKSEFVKVIFKNVRFIEEATRILALEMLYTLSECCKKVVVDWYYTNPKILEIGEEFDELLDIVEFNFYEV